LTLAISVQKPNTNSGGESFMLSSPGNDFPANARWVISLFPVMLQM
jgi:hypothetical protein